jgi:hypothetical protein
VAERVLEHGVEPVDEPVGMRGFDAGVVAVETNRVAVVVDTDQ